jgi:hypothetical protein
MGYHGNGKPIDGKFQGKKVAESTQITGEDGRF